MTYKLFSSINDQPGGVRVPPILIDESECAYPIPKSQVNDDETDI